MKARTQDVWRATVDSGRSGLSALEQAEICSAWRRFGNAEAHTLLIVPDTISAYEVGERLEDELCIDHPG